MLSGDGVQMEINEDESAVETDTGSPQAYPFTLDQMEQSSLSNDDFPVSPVSFSSSPTGLFRITGPGNGHLPDWASPRLTIDEDQAEPQLGLLAIFSHDQDTETQFAPQSKISGKYGEFTIDADGYYNYTLNTDKTQILAAGQTVSDTFTVTNADGTFSDEFVITIIGEDDLPPLTIAQADVPRRVGVERTFSLVDIDPAPGEMVVRWEVYYVGAGLPLVTQFIDATESLRFTPIDPGPYEVRATAINQVESDAVSSVTFSASALSTKISLEFRDPSPGFPLSLQTASYSFPAPQQSFHEWEDVTVGVWIEARQELFNVNQANFKWEVFVDNPLFGEVQSVVQAGSESSWEVIPHNGGWLIRGEVVGFETVKFHTISRIQIASIVLPRNLENMQGLSVAEVGNYPQGRIIDGIELLSASLVKPEADYSLRIVAGNGAVMVPVVYDSNDDGQVGLTDFSGMVENFGKTVGENAPEAYRYDYNRNGKVDLADFTLFIQHFGSRKEQGISNLNIPFLTTEEPEVVEEDPPEEPNLNLPPPEEPLVLSQPPIISELQIGVPNVITSPELLEEHGPPPNHYRRPQLIAYVLVDRVTASISIRYQWREDPALIEELLEQQTLPAIFRGTQRDLDFVPLDPDNDELDLLTIDEMYQKYNEWVGSDVF